MRYSRDISFCRRLLLSRHALIAAKRMTVLQKPLNVYMMCSLYASVQGINDSPFLPHRAVHGLQFQFYNSEGRQHFVYRSLIIHFIIPDINYFSRTVDRPFDLSPFSHCHCSDSSIFPLSKMRGILWHFPTLISLF